MGNSRSCSLALARLPSNTSLELPFISNFFSAEFTVTFTMERLGLASTKSTVNFQVPFLGRLWMLKRMLASCVLQPEVPQVPPQVSSGPGST